MKQLPERINLSLEPSSKLAVFIAASHLLSLIIASSASLGLVQKTVLTAAILISFQRNWRRWVRLDASASIIGLELAPGGGWTLFGPTGKAMPARLLNSSVVHPCFALLSFSIGGVRRRRVVLLSDNADPVAVRRLRVRLSLDSFDRRRVSSSP